VRYEAVNAMLLNEFLKEHSKVSKLEAENSKLGADTRGLAATVASQAKAIAAQEEEIKALMGGLKQQAALIQKVSGQLNADRLAPEMAANN
jgi:hypothetical protein